VAIFAAAAAAVVVVVVVVVVVLTPISNILFLLSPFNARHALLFNPSLKKPGPSSDSEEA
jgi:hypothetical protein